MANNPNTFGGAAWKGMEKMNSELFTLTYGALVSQLIRDHEDVEAVNVQLEKMGYNIGVRLIDEFLAKSNTERCANFESTANLVAKVGLKMFLGVNAQVDKWNSEKTACSITLADNPFQSYVELPPSLSKLCYCNLMCGVIRGALEMVNLVVTCEFVKQKLRGHDVDEIRLTLQSVREDQPPPDDE